LAITEPPLRHKVIAAIDGLDWERRSSVRARAERSNSRHRAGAVLWEFRGGQDEISFGKQVFQGCEFFPL